MPVEVKNPKQLRGDPDYATSRANTRKIIIKTHRKQRDFPAQRVHIDIANVPTHDASPQLIRTQYDNLPDGYDAMLFLSSSKAEILADKLIAIPARNNIKARDLWDIIWLQQNTNFNVDLIEQKIIDHGIASFKDRLESRIESLPPYFETGLFEQEMSRFLDSSRLSETVKRPEFLEYLKNRVEETLTQLHARLYTPQKERPGFTL